MKNIRGFTLPELLVTVVVVGILALVALPNGLEVIAKNRVEGAANELRTDIQYARAEAIRLRTTVTVMVGAGGTYYSLLANGQSIKTIPLPSGTTLAGDTLAIEPLRGHASTVAEFTVSNPSANGSLKIVVSVVGLPSTCVVTGSFYGVSTACPAVASE